MISGGQNRHRPFVLRESKINTVCRCLDKLCKKSMVEGRLRPPFVASRLVFALIHCTAGCETPSAPDAPIDAREEIPVSELRQTPIPQGERILEPDELEDTQGAAMRSEASVGASPYGCIFSSPAPRHGEDPYRYDAVYLHFPKGTVEAAEGGMRLTRFRMARSRLYAREEREDPVITRMASCRIPRTPGAAKMVRKRFEQFERIEDVRWEGMAISEYEQRLQRAGSHAQGAQSSCSRFSNGSSGEGAASQGHRTAGRMRLRQTHRNAWRSRRCTRVCRILPTEDTATARTSTATVAGING